MRRAFYFVTSSAAIKAAPLAQSALIIYLAGPGYYAEIARYFVISSFVSTLFTTGVVPGYTRSAGEKYINKLSNSSASPFDYVLFVMSAIPISAAIVIALYVIGALGEFNPAVAITYSVSVGLISLLVPVSLILDKLNSTMLAVYLSLLSSVAVGFASAYLPVSIFQYVFVVPFLLLAIAMLFLFSINNQQLNDYKKIKNIDFRRLRLVIQDIYPVFVPNVFAMLMLFLFAHRISQNESSADYFSWYVVGLQLYGALSFVPNSLAPLILLRFTLNETDDGYKESIKYSLYTILIAFAVLVAAVVVVELMFRNIFTSTQMQIWVPMLVAGCFASSVAPLNAFLIKQHRASYIFPGTIVWAVIAHLWLTFDQDAFPHAFLAASVGSWCVLFVFARMAKKLPRKQELAS